MSFFSRSSSGDHGVLDLELVMDWRLDDGRPCMDTLQYSSDHAVLFAEACRRRAILQLVSTTEW